MKEPDSVIVASAIIVLTVVIDVKLHQFPVSSLHDVLKPAVTLKLVAVFG